MTIIRNLPDPNTTKHILNQILPDEKLISEVILNIHGELLKNSYNRYEELAESLNFTTNISSVMTDIFYVVIGKTYSSLMNGFEELFMSINYMKRLINRLKLGLLSDFETKDPSTLFEIDFINNEWAKVEKTFYDLGYDFHYFNFFKRDEPLVKVFWNNIKVTAQIFEAATSLYNMDVYNHVLNNINEKDFITINSERISGLIRVDKGLQLTGWKKIDLKNAIMKTGLNIPQKTGKFKIDKKNNKSIEIMKSPLAKFFNYKRSKLPGIDNLGIKDPAYKSKYYYEAIYRRLFSTLLNVDWSQVCQKKLVRFDQLQKITTNEFGFDLKDIQDLDYIQTCKLLTIESERRRKLKDELKINIPNIQPEILYQPGSELVSHLTKATQRMMTPILGPQKEINPIYGEIYNLCSDQYITVEKVYFEASKMGLLNIINVNQTKKEMCNTLINYIETIQTNNLF